MAMSVSPSPDTLQLVLCTCPQSEARDLAQSLVGRRLAACVNILPTVSSVYRWDEQVVAEDEALLMIKTCADQREALFTQLAELHPYAVPEIISLPAGSVWPGYQAWVRDETRPLP